MNRSRRLPLHRRKKNKICSKAEEDRPKNRHHKKKRLTKNTKWPPVKTCLQWDLDMEANIHEDQEVEGKLSIYSPSETKESKNNNESISANFFSPAYLTEDQNLVKNIADNGKGNMVTPPLEDMEGYSRPIIFPADISRTCYDAKEDQCGNNNTDMWNFDLGSTIRNNWTMDDFETDKIVGSGKFGEVCVCFNKVSKEEKYCLKKISKEDIMSSSKNYVILKREVEIHVRLNHPNIVSCHGFFLDGSSACLVLEACEHGDIYQSRLCNEGSTIPHREASQYVAQVIKAMSYLHYNHVFHRDIKPENLLLCGRTKGVVKVCDFGWAVHANNSKDMWRSTLCGTPEYVPIEMVDYVPYSIHYDADEKVKKLRKKGIKARTRSKSLEYDVRYVDSWALGILAFELVRGSTPFHIDEKSEEDLREEKGYMNKYEVTFDRIRETKNIVCADLKNKSDEDIIFQDFVSSMTKRKAQDRLSADQALRHEWITQFS